jgi:hypothetical protein
MGLEAQAGSIDQNNISILKVSWSSRLEYLGLPNFIFLYFLLLPQISTF